MLFAISFVAWEGFDADGVNAVENVLFDIWIDSL